MVRNKKTIEKKLREINNKSFNILTKSFLYRFLHNDEIENLKIQSKTLAWVLNKIEHDPRGNRYYAKKQNSK